MSWSIIVGGTDPAGLAEALDAAHAEWVEGDQATPEADAQVKAAKAAAVALAPAVAGGGHVRVTLSGHASAADHPADVPRLEEDAVTVTVVYVAAPEVA